MLTFVAVSWTVWNLTFSWIVLCNMNEYFVTNCDHVLDIWNLTFSQIVLCNMNTLLPDYSWPRHGHLEGHFHEVSQSLQSIWAIHTWHGHELRNGYSYHEYQIHGRVVDILNLNFSLIVPCTTNTDFVTICIGLFQILIFTKSCIVSVL
jgi:hypothetical protein